MDANCRRTPDYAGVSPGLDCGPSGRTAGGPPHTLPPLEPQPWPPRDRLALAAILLLIALLMFPLARVGERDASGSRLYRAYFTADFIWHTALASELGKYAMPPRNPYFAREEMHYYWTYFLPPAVIAASGPALLRDVQLALKMNELMTALIFGGVLFVLARAATGSGPAAAAGLAITLVAASAEGTYALYDLAQRSRPLWLVKNLNIDAVAAWRWGGLRIDGLVRALWYNPQHSTSCALGMIACIAALTGGVSMPRAAVLAAAGALALSVTFNPFIGAALGSVYGVVLLTETLRLGTWRMLWRQTVVPVAAVIALGWCVANRMLEGASGALLLGWGGLARHAPVATLLVSLGPLLAIGAAGVLPRRVGPTRGLTLAAALSGLSLVLMYFVRLDADAAWVGFRAGQLLQIGLAILAARALAAGRSAVWRAAGVTLALVVLAVGLPTLVIDLYNAQDLSNRGMGPGFHWTVAVTPAQQEAFSWMQRATRPDAVVQMDPAAHGRETWSLIPSFGARRMAAGQPIALLPGPNQARLSARVSALYASLDAEGAAEEARALGIDYLYLDERERSVYDAAALQKFSTSASFLPVFRNNQVLVYAVRR